MLRKSNAPSPKPSASATANNFNHRTSGKYFPEVRWLKLLAVALADGFGEGALDLRSNERLEREDSKRGDVQFVRLETKNTGPSMVWPGRNFGGDATWNLALAPKIPMVLRLNTGVGESRIDLADLKVTDLTLNTGIGRTSLVLPSTGAVRAQVDSGIGETNIRIPTGMDARIRASSGIGAVTVNGNYQRDGETYTSPGFSSASNRVELEVKGGIGRVSVDPGR